MKQIEVEYFTYRFSQTTGGNAIVLGDIQHYRERNKNPYAVIKEWMQSTNRLVQEDSVTQDFFRSSDLLDYIGYRLCSLTNAGPLEQVKTYGLLIDTVKRFKEKTLLFMNEKGFQIAYIDSSGKINGSFQDPTTNFLIIEENFLTNPDYHDTTQCLSLLNKFIGRRDRLVSDLQQRFKSPTDMWMD